ENRLVVTLDADVKAVERLPTRGFLAGDQSLAAIGRHQIEDRVRGIGRLIGEIKARIDLPQHAARIDAKHDVRRLRLAVWPRHRTGLDRVEAEDAVLVGGGAAEAPELGV